MNRNVSWHPDAVADARDAHQWYVDQAPLAAERFLAELDLVVEWISTMPHACPPGELNTRFSLLKTFPYVIHFRVQENDVQVLAVAHARRQPGYWHARLES